MPNLGLSTPIRYLKGVGPKMEGRLIAALSVETIQDLLLYFPRTYHDYSKIIPIKDARVGDEVTIRGIVWESTVRPTKTRRKMLQAVFSDSSGTIKAIWFNQKYWAKQLKEGEEYYISGKVTVWHDEPFMNNPTIEPVSEQTLHTAKIVAVYPETAGVTSKYIRKLIANARELIPNLPEMLPEEIVRTEKLLPYAQAVSYIHFPNNDRDINEATKTLGFKEIFLLLLSRLMVKSELRKAKALSVKYDVELVKELVSKLPFVLTLDQKKAVHQILKDIEQPKPMSRLLQGDVGSGKTVVASIAALLTAKSGYQTVFMAPTEILANQHYKTVSSLLEPFGVKVSLVTGSKKESLDADILIGTHALIQESVTVPKLALAIIDEQHRFGVSQRAKLMSLREQRSNLDRHGQNPRDDIYMPHMLSMTATPIPRTLALTLYGDLDISTIREMPRGRKKIDTQVIDDKHRGEAYKFIREQISIGRQAFVITPLIDESDKLGFKSVIKEHEKLDNEVFPDLAIGLLHGKMKSKEKEQVMQDFKAGKYSILVATPVVEVGVDVPNATVMIIESAQRFGLAQLHQFRGRVGRAEHQSYCFIFTDVYEEMPRLKAMEQTNDGFELAEKDLMFRGPGEATGLKQSGYLSLRFASIYDQGLIARARNAAISTLEISSDLTKFPELKDAISNTETVLA